MARALINAPAQVKRGEIIEIKTLISHNMETGFRPDNTGKPVPRDIITDFICKYNGQEIFRAELFPAIAANPFLTFFTVATESGTLSFEWTGDNGFTATESVNLTVKGGRRRLSFGRPRCGAPRRPPARFRSPIENRATSSWRARRAPCRMTTPPIPACCGCSTVKRSGSARRVLPPNHAPIAMATRGRA